MEKESPSKGGKLLAGSPTDPVAFGKYYLLGLIARGGMAEVYRAREIAGGPTPTLLAIKVMRPELAKETRFVDMFHREGQLAMLLQSPSIVRTLEVGLIEGRHFIAMEYIGGRDLTQVLRRCQKENLRIPVPHAVYIGARIAEGLEFAHKLIGPDGRPLNIVNRDVSPSNVRLSYDGEAKMLDFGIAQALMKFTSEIGVLKGKFSYMSPEQIRGMPVDARTDVFSAGIILHEMLTTEKLFRGDTEFALMEKVRKAEIDPPSKLNRRVTPELDAIVLKALARDVAERYQTSAELHRDLRNLLEGYRFDPRELREFMRKEFRTEYLKEVDEVSRALVALPVAVRQGLSEEMVTSVIRKAPGEVFKPPMGAPRPPSPSPSVPPATAPALASSSASPAATAATPAPVDGGEVAETSDEMRAGFWSKMFRKKK